ncbi:hypothetical protein KCU81_g564, partial [Aureobasidium melanogenum]
MPTLNSQPLLLFPIAQHNNSVSSGRRMPRSNHNPAQSVPNQTPVLTRQTIWRSSLSVYTIPSPHPPMPLPHHPTSIPRALLDWLNTYHNPFPDDLTDVMRHRPTPVAHDRFWDMVYACTLRGDILNAISLLETADWSQAESAIEDGYDEPGYSGSHLHAVREVVSRCVDLLSTCPAVTENDWDVKGSDWTIFRHRVRRELQDLQDFAEADSRDKDQFPAAPFGRVSMSFSTASRRAESKVPWLIYESLKTLTGWRPLSFLLPGGMVKTTMSSQMTSLPVDAPCASHNPCVKWTSRLYSLTRNNSFWLSLLPPTNPMKKSSTSILLAPSRSVLPAFVKTIFKVLSVS